MCFVLLTGCGDAASISVPSAGDPSLEQSDLLGALQIGATPGHGADGGPFPGARCPPGTHCHPGPHGNAETHAASYARAYAFRTAPGQYPLLPLPRGFRHSDLRQ